MTKAERYKAMLIKIRHKNGNAADLEAFVMAESALTVTGEPTLNGSKALVLYFDDDADRDEFVATWNEVHPNAISKKVL
jgi:hypothetical protein